MFYWSYLIRFVSILCRLVNCLNLQKNYKSDLLKLKSALLQKEELFTFLNNLNLIFFMLDLKYQLLDDNAFIFYLYCKIITENRMLTFFGHELSCAIFQHQLLVRFKVSKPASLLTLVGDEDLLLLHSVSGKR